MAQLRREMITAAALSLFADRGFEATTLMAIEEAAGLAPGRGAIYRYFPDKEAILHAAVTEGIARCVPAPSEGEDEAPADLAQLQERLREAIDSMMQMRDLIALLVKDGQRFPDLRAALLAGMVDSGIAVNTAGLVNVTGQDGAVDLARLASLLLTATVGAALLNTLVDPGTSLDEQALVDGLGSCLDGMLRAETASGR